MQKLSNEYDIVLKEKEGTNGLTKEETLNLFSILPESEVFPLDLQARCHECAAMGFITTKAAEVLNYDYEQSGLHDYVAGILDNIENEVLSNSYGFKGLSIYLSR